MLALHSVETTSHFFLSCIYSQQAWKELGSHLGLSNLWCNDSIEACFHDWFSNIFLKPYKTLPFLVMWSCGGTWLARNSAVFDDKVTPYFQTFAKVLGVYNFYKTLDGQKPSRSVGPLWVEKAIPRCFFDGTSCNNVCGCGMVVYRSDSNYFHMKANFRSGTNNYWGVYDSFSSP